jgi:hypothetical protein
MKERRIIRFGAVTIAAVSVLIFVVLGYADSNSVTFESPTYHTGSVNGQDGWSSIGAYDQAVVTNTYGYATFGGQSLRISDAITSGSFGDQTFSKSLLNECGETNAENSIYSGGIRQRHCEFSFDLASTLATLQAGMHLSVSPDRGDGARMSYLRFEDQADGIHVFFDDVTDPGHVINGESFNETDIATISRTPHRLKFVMDFADGPDNDVVKIYIDGVLKITGTSWEDYYAFDEESDPTLNGHSRTVDSLLFREGGDAAPAHFGYGFLIDNLNQASSRPTPTSGEQCKNGGWQNYVRTNATAFKNQGDCIQYVNTGK